LSKRQEGQDLIILYEDDGIGIPILKRKIFLNEVMEKIPFRAFSDQGDSLDNRSVNTGDGEVWGGGKI
jgi:hypothetical protein